MDSESSIFEHTPQYKNRYEEILSTCVFSNEEAREKTVKFFESFPELPEKPEEAFAFVRQYFITNGFKYEGRTFSLENIIETKQANCLGFCVLFGVILEANGFDVTYEVVVNAEDAHYKYDIKTFDKLIHGDIFSYDNPPPLPTESEEAPQNRFVSLQHPVLTVGGKSYETTDLSKDEETEDGPGLLSFEHDYKSETRQRVTLTNLFGSLCISESKTILSGDTVDKLSQATDLAEKGLMLWPEDSQGWVLLRDLGIEQFDDDMRARAEKHFFELNEDNSLYNFSRYNMTGDREALDRSLLQYPAFVEAYILKNIKLPLVTDEQKKDARFLYTVGAQCVVNSAEMDLGDFYHRHLEGIVEAFGPEESEDLVNDMLLDETNPREHALSMYRITKDTQFLLDAIQAGELEHGTPKANLHFCKTVIKEIPEGGSEDEEQARGLCLQTLEALQEKYSNSPLYQKELQQFV